MIKWIVGFPLVKGAIIGVALTAVIHNAGLSLFAQGLIIALISAFIGAVGVIVAAIISARSAEQVMKEQLKPVKKAVGADRREEDQ